MKDLLDRVAGLPPQKRALLAARNPLSFAQQRLWLIDQMEPGCTAYNLPFPLELAGRLDLACLGRSLGEIVRRHQVLRTTFLALDGQALQVVHPVDEMEIPRIDLLGLEEARRRETARALIAAEAWRPFDLMQGPLLRCTLIRLARESHVLLLAVHHIAGDGWSLEILVRELSILYESFLAGRPSPLPELPLQYGDFARWQRQWLRGEVLERQLAYWRSHLQSVPPGLELPTDRPRPKARSYRGARRVLDVSPPVVNGLHALARQADTTLFVALLTAWAVLLARWTGQGDLVIGFPVANRTRGEIEPLIGFFVNMLAARMRLAGKDGFAELLRRTRGVVLDAQDHQDVPFEKLVDELQPERSLSHTPLFQVVCVLLVRPGLRRALPGLRLSSVEIEVPASPYDLTLSALEVDDKISLRLEHSSDLFDDTTMQRLLARFELLLAAVVADPCCRLSLLPLLSAGERRQLLAWSGAAWAHPASRCVHELFQEQAAQQPDAVALVGPAGEEWTYGELNRQANRLAHLLRGLGVGPEVPVGVCLESSPEMIAAFLAVLKAGGAYVPLDPTYPASRLAFLVEDTGSPLAITREPWIEAVRGTGARALCLEWAADALAREREDDPPSLAWPDSLAYVMYTSGSTGTPKGVAVLHRGIQRLVRDQRYLELSAGDVFLQSAPATFDASTLEIWGPLLNGGRLILFPGGGAALGELAELLGRHEVTTLWLTAGLFHRFADDWIDALAPLRHLLAGGDVLSPEHVRRVLARFPGLHLVNGYGPTESTTFTCCHVLRRPEDVGSAVSIGTPIRGSEVFVLDPEHCPVFPGSVGELCIGGAGLARGYLGRPDLTAAKLIPHPLSPQPGERLYRTGDLVRHLPDGTLAFLGRFDHQVKVRGFRIEMGEIETVLSRHPLVREAAVRVWDGAPGRKRLVAYVVPRSPALSARELRSFLKESLPDYMLPSEFVRSEGLPMTATGKLDRQALPAPNGTRTLPEEDLVLPSTSEEEVLAKIWARVLGLDSVGVHDNFFELGGDSILAIQIVSRACEVGMRLTPRDLFENQTVAELAAVAWRGPAAHATASTMPEEIPLNPIQQWFFAQGLPAPHHWNQSVLLQAREPVDAPRLAAACKDLIRHHQALRSRFHSGARGWTCRVAAAEDGVAFSWLDLAGLRGAAAESAFEQAAAVLQASLDLENGPVFRAVLVSLGEGREDRLLLTVHHLVVDAVSWRILLEDLDRAYTRRLCGAAACLPAVTTSAAEWVLRLVEHARAGHFDGEAPYWLDEARTRVPRLPIDLPGGGNTRALAETLRISLDPGETEALLQEIPAALHTQINDVLLTALAQTFGRRTGNPWLLVDLEGHGREPLFEEVDLSRTVGWFTTRYPVLLHLGRAGDGAAALQEVKAQLRAVPGRGIGYGALLSLRGDAELASRLLSLPRAEVSFNYLGRFDATFAAVSAFALGREAIGPMHDSRGARSHLLEVDAWVTAGRLEIGWTYSRALHRPATVEALARDFVESLRGLIAHGRAPGAGGYTVADFPHARLSAQELADLLSVLQATDGL